MIRKSLICAVALAFAASFALVATSMASNGPEEMVLQTSAAKKPANFNHKKHQEMEGMECATCHHTKTDDGKQGPYVAGQEGKCETCHNAAPNDFKAVAHKLCKDCHKEKGGNAPTKCDGCHVKK